MPVSSLFGDEGHFDVRMVERVSGIHAVIPSGIGGYRDVISPRRADRTKPMLITQSWSSM